MNKFLSYIIFYCYLYIFYKMYKETESEASNEIIVPNIIKTESQIRDEAYKADSLYGSIITLEDYWLVFKKIGETQYGFNFGDQKVEIYTDLTIASSDSTETMLRNSFWFL